MRWLRTAAALCCALLAAPTSGWAQADTDPANTIPVGGSAFLSTLQTFLRNEDADRYREQFRDGVSTVANATACLGATAAGLSHTPTACVAYPGGHRITETGAITYGDAALTWVIIDEDESGDSGTFTRVAGTHYLLDESATQPTIPTDAILIMAVTTAGGAITNVADLRPTLPVDVGSAATLVTEFSTPAACDGASDDAAAIQAAIDAVTAAGGGIVRIPGGATCVLGSGLTLKDNVHLQGANWSSALQLEAAAVAVLITITNCDDCTISDLMLDGNGDNTTSVSGANDDAFVIYGATGVNRLHLRNLYVDDSENGSIVIKGTSSQIRLSNVYITNAGDDGDQHNNNSAVYMDGSGATLTDVFVDGLVVDVSARKGLGLDDVSRFTVSNVLVQTAEQVAVEFFECSDGAVSNVTIRDNTGLSFSIAGATGGSQSERITASSITVDRPEGIAFEVADSRWVAASAVHIDSTDSTSVPQTLVSVDGRVLGVSEVALTGFSIEAANASTAAVQVIAQGVGIVTEDITLDAFTVDCAGGGVDGIKLNHSNGTIRSITVSNSTVRDCTSDGIAINVADDVTIIGNTLVGNAANAIASTNTTDRISIIGNYMDLGGGRCATITGTGLTYSGNVCQASASHTGGYFAGGADIAISGNVYDSNGQAAISAGINISTGTQVTISGNRLTSEDSGIQLGTAASDVTIVGNVITFSETADANEHGVFASVAASQTLRDIVIADNIIHSPASPNANSSGVRIQCAQTTATCDNYVIRGNLIQTPAGGTPAGTGIQVTTNATSAGNVYIENNVIDNVPTGMTWDASWTAQVAKNNEFISVTTPYSGTEDASQRIIDLGGSVAFADIDTGGALDTVATGSYVLCTDCDVTTPGSCTSYQASAAACVCAGSGAGALARYLDEGGGAAWYCD
jgi:hypothetical protein